MRRAIAVLLVALAACSAGRSSSSGHDRTPARSTSTPGTPPATAGRTFVRACGSQVSGQLAPDVLRHSTNVGPLTLVYRPARFQSTRLAAGDVRVTFRPCRPHQRIGTQFNGDVLVDGPRCVALDIAWDGGRHRRIEASFDAGSCGASPSP